ncbi:MAG: helix-turn-helix domain-containing protein [Clostridia bacterium]|nr:helix-turn-helix domain-containing protein [Clostridia bacterium]
MSKSKLTYLERIAAVKEYLAGNASQKAFAEKLGVGQSTFRDWVTKYKNEGSESLSRTRKRTYSPKLKKAAVLAYLQKEGSLSEICKMYAIKDRRSLRCWINAYNGHKEILSTNEKRSFAPMTQRKSTTLEERIEIVGYCLELSKDYAAAMQKYGVSYQQIYSWVKKYEAQGAAALVDRRGKRKSPDSLDETARLRAENKLLLARIRQAEMENLVLKKLEELERRGC